MMITVEDDGSVLVVAPERMSVELIESYLKKKEGWVVRKVGEKREQLEKWKPHTFRRGDEFYVFGKLLKLEFADIEAKVEIEETYILVRDDLLDKDEIQTAIEDALKKMAREYFKRAVEVYEKKMSTKASRVWLSSAQSRWGSCNSRNGLNLNWRLIMAPKGVIHSVVVHELAHTIRKDHSKAFWEIVYKHYPNYKKAKKWLKENELMLRWD